MNERHCTECECVCVLSRRRIPRTFKCSGGVGCWVRMMTTLLIMMHAANQFCCIMPKVCTSAVAIAGGKWRKTGWGKATSISTKVPPRRSAFMLCPLLLLVFLRILFGLLAGFPFYFHFHFFWLSRPAAAMPFLCRNTLGACGFGLHP